MPCSAAYGWLRSATTGSAKDVASVLLLEISEHDATSPSATAEIQSSPTKFKAHSLLWGRWPHVSKNQDAQQITSNASTGEVMAISAFTIVNKGESIRWTDFWETKLRSGGILLFELERRGRQASPS